MAFTLYGVLLFLCTTHLPKYATVLRCVLWVFFASGLARSVSIALYGFPPPMVMALWVSELLPPPLLIWWLARVEKQSQQDHRVHPKFRAGQVTVTGQ